MSTMDDGTHHFENDFEHDVEHGDFDRLLDEVSRMDDDALDAVVARVAGDYNAAPARPPVESMWTRIAATQKPAPRGVHVQRWQLLAASVAFVAFGVTIGHEWSGLPARIGAPVPRESRTVASTPDSAHPTTPKVGATTAGAASATTHAVHPSQVADGGSVVMHEGSYDSQHDVQHGASRSAIHVASHRLGDVSAERPSTSHAAPRAGDDASFGGSTTRSDAAYQVATMRHFVAAEALLASYDGSSRDAKTDAQLASWASDLLSQTRLLIDSPAGRDPIRRRLLQDLELVLVQMAQLGPGTPKLEHDLIDGSVRHNDIITRLRSAVPAGATTAL